MRVCCAITRSHWQTWGAWSDCSATCDGGTRTRSRACDDAFPDFPCEGDSEESAGCNGNLCGEFDFLYYQELQKQDDLRGCLVLLAFNCKTWRSKSLVRHHMTSFLVLKIIIVDDSTEFFDKKFIFQLMLCLANVPYQEVALIGCFLAKVLHVLQEQGKFYQYHRVYLPSKFTAIEYQHKADLVLQL